VSEKLGIDHEVLARAGQRIRSGGVVAFPTETVYGLGADARNPAAVEQIFRIKHRPRNSPLIVHVDSIRMACELVQDWPVEAQRLAERFWPGPLTMVLHKLPVIPDVVTAGLHTVGIRMPAHPVALALIREAGAPIAAPSANPFTRLSPTTARHVKDALGEKVDLILDGGRTPVGIESTVLSLAVSPPHLLRPGMISQKQIEEVIGPITAVMKASGDMGTEAHPSPGMHPKHYSPHTPLILVDGGALPSTGRGVYLWRKIPVSTVAMVPMPEDAVSYAAVLYETLHREDSKGWDWIAVEKPPCTPEWDGIWDRLSRAAVQIS